MATLSDAHCHLQDPRLDARRKAVSEALAAVGVTRHAVNGTCERDWAAVRALAARPDGVCPSYGIHPWRVGVERPGWAERLDGMLREDPAAGVGETGLDAARAAAPLGAQMDVFEAHIAIAARRNRPLSVHCVRAWGPLIECLGRVRPPERGFLVHAFSGSRDILFRLADLGGIFGFNAGVCARRAARARDAFRAAPPDRVLIETDAPALPAPDGLRPFTDPPWDVLNHPANLPTALDLLADLRGERPESVRNCVESNYSRFFMSA